MTDLIFNITRLGLLVLSFGAGQDSTTIFYRFLLDPAFRSAKLNGRNLVLVFADTGDERAATYDHMWRIKDLCNAYGIKCIHLASAWTIEMHKKNGRSVDHITTGFHSESWAALAAQYLRNHNLAIRRNKSCTDNLKIKPIYRWLNSFCAELMGEKIKDHGKQNIQAYAKQFGKIEMMIGFAKGEESRVKKAAKAGKQKWWQSIEKTFPLVDVLSMDRLECISYMETTPWGACGPSMCKMCPNITKQTLVLMWLDDRASFIDWARHEKRKLKKWAPIQAAKGEANSYALGGTKDLFGELREALETFKDWSLEDLKEYDFKNGHCISNGY